MLQFALRNPYSCSLDRHGPLPALYRLLTVSSPSIHSLDLSGYTGATVLVTGATSGCGLECARALSRVPCRLLLTYRDVERGESVKREMVESARADVSMLPLDMKSPQAVRALSSRLEALFVEHLDVVILNAGVYQTEFRICTETGWDETAQVNFLATAALTLLLRPLLCRSRSRSARLLLVSSEAHAWADPQQDTTRALLDALTKHPDPPYPCYQRYHISKLLLVLWVRELTKRDDWASVSVASVSPGFSSSALFRDFNHLPLAKALERCVCRTSDRGASQYASALGQLAKGDGKGAFWSNGGWAR